MKKIAAVLEVLILRRVQLIKKAPKSDFRHISLQGGGDWEFSFFDSFSFPFFLFLSLGESIFSV